MSLQSVCALIFGVEKKRKMKRNVGFRTILALALAVIILSTCVSPALPTIGSEVQASSEATLTAIELLGRPTDNSVTVNVLAEPDVEVYFEYGNEQGVYNGKPVLPSFLAVFPSK